MLEQIFIYHEKTFRNFKSVNVLGQTIKLQRICFNI